MRSRLFVFFAVLLALLMTVPAAGAHDDPGVTDDPDEETQLVHAGAAEALAAHDAEMDGIVSSGPFSKVVKNVSAVGRGERIAANVTTDVWAYDGYAYTGTFSTLCSTGDNDSGVWVWDVSNKNKPTMVTVIDTAAGSKTNDVRVAGMNSGDVLVMSNENCGGGPGGFDIYNVDDPTNPVFITRVQTDDVNAFLRDVFGFVDHGVHNLWLFTQGAYDYVAVTVESDFGNFQIFDITDPANPTLVGFWGAEQLAGLGVTDWETLDDFDVILAADAYVNTGFGQSANRKLHDVTIDAAGQTAYLANWDAGLVTLDISDPSNPALISVAIDPTSEDGEVNSHAVWPNEDGSIVIEGEEDFAPFTTVFSITSGLDAGDYGAAEGAFTTPIITLPGSEMSGPTTYVGTACNGEVVPGGSDIALVQRGACRFDEKATNVIDAGYTGFVMFNNADDSFFTMGGADRDIPGVMVGNSTGLLIAGVASSGDLVVGAAGESISAAVEPDGWSGFRIWDFADPTNPVLASTFNTVCSANPVDPICDPAGTYSSHNVQVETLGNKVLAYISWYSDGMLVLDISDPYNPVEVARYTDDSLNGGLPIDFWGVYKEANSPFFYGADRNGGLYVFKLKGSGSGK